MKKRIGKCLRKLKDTGGESISEVLISTLIIELALLMVVSMIMSAGRMINRSEVSYRRYYAARNSLETNQEETWRASTGGAEKTVSPVSGTDTVTVRSTGSGATTEVLSVPVRTYRVYYENDAETEDPLTLLYRYEAVPEGSPGGGDQSGEEPG